MKQLLAWAGSADSTITSEAVMAMLRNSTRTGGLRADSQRAWSYASQSGHLRVMLGHRGARQMPPDIPDTAAGQRE
jgi:hypothetical protein